MNEFHADLHCHSVHSDGSLSVSELIRLAVDVGLQGLSITDHDSLGAYPEVLELASQSGIALIPGIELSCVHGRRGVHILGYGFDPEHPAMISWCQETQEGRRKRNQAIQEALYRIHLPISDEDLLTANPHLPPNAGIGRPHFAAAMVAKGYVPNVQQAFKRYLGEGAACHVPWGRLSITDGINTIHEAGGLAVLAHPHIIKDSKLLAGALSHPFDGIEAHYARFGTMDAQRWIKHAERKNWFITGGSDFHGAPKPHISLGSSWVPRSTFDHITQSCRQKAQ